MSCLGAGRLAVTVDMLLRDDIGPEMRLERWVEAGRPHAYIEEGNGWLKACALPMIS